MTSLFNRQHRSLSVFLVDDSPLVRGNLVELLSLLPGIEICGQAESVSQAVSELSTHRPDVVILDLNMPGGSGLDVLRSIKGSLSPSPTVIILSMHPYRELGARCLDAGADFYFEKGADLEGVLGVITDLSQRNHLRPTDPEQADADSADLILPPPPPMPDDSTAKSALPATDELFRHISDSSRNRIEVLDLTGRLLWINTGGLRAMEMDNFETMQHMAWLALWQGEEQEAALAAISAAKARGTGTFTGSSLTANGNLKWWEVVVTSILGASGEVERLLAISRDITDRKTAEEAITRQLEELQGWQEVTLGREDRILALKAEVNQLLTQLNRPIRYATAATP